MSQYEKKRLDAIYKAEKRKEQVYNQIPRLQEIDSILSKEAIHVSKLLLSENDPSLLEDLNKKIEDLKKEKQKLLNSYGKNSEYLKPFFECSDCSDTGYISNNYKTEMCHCLKQKLFNLEYNKSNIYNLEKQNFDNFSLDVYSDDSDETKYNSAVSPRENIQKIIKICNRFISNFDNENEKNLLFTGNTGLRKNISF